MSTHFQIVEKNLELEEKQLGTLRKLERPSDQILARSVLLAAGIPTFTFTLAAYYLGIQIHYVFLFVAAYLAALLWITEFRFDLLVHAIQRVGDGFTRRNV